VGSRIKWSFHRHLSCKIFSLFSLVCSRPKHSFRMCWILNRIWRCVLYKITFSYCAVNKFHYKKEYSGKLSCSLVCWSQYPTHLIHSTQIQQHRESRALGLLAKSYPHGIAQDGADEHVAAIVGGGPQALNHRWVSAMHQWYGVHYWLI